MHRIGRWRIENHVLDGSEMILVNAALVPIPMSPVSDGLQMEFGDMGMHVHQRSGRVAFARNEVADWYYEPVK